MKKKIILFLLDGCRRDVFYKADIPNIRSLAKEGIDGLMCRTVFPSSTGPAQLALLTGYFPERTGVTGHFYWDKNNKKLVDIQTFTHCEAKYLNDILAGEGIGSYLRGSRVTWKNKSGIPPVQYLMRRFASFIFERQGLMQRKALYPFFNRIRYNDRLFNYIKGDYSQFLKFLNDDKYNFYYMVFNFIDKAGHIYGPTSPEYIRAIELSDKMIGQAIVRIKDKSNVSIIIMSDHGQTEINKKIDIEEFSLEKIGYRLDALFRHPVGKEIQIVKYNFNQSNMAVATFVTRHVQVWLHDLGDIKKAAGFFLGIPGVDRVLTGDDYPEWHLGHCRTADLTVTLKKGYGFSGNDWKGDHGGINDEDICIPCIFYPRENWMIKRKDFNIVDIAPTICRAFGLKGNYHFQGESLIE